MAKEFVEKNKFVSHFCELFILLKKIARFIKSNKSVKWESNPHIFAERTQINIYQYTPSLT